MSAALATRTGFKFMISVRQGPDKGASYQLLPPKVTLGRGADNNIAFADPKVSRQAAVIEFSMERIVITDVSTRQSMMVNGQVVEEASIKSGDIVSIGETEFVFIVEALQIGANGMPQQAQIAGGGGNVMPFPNQPLLGGGAPNLPPPPRRTSAPRAASNNTAAGKLRFYLILAVVVGGAVWFLTQQKPARIQEPDIRSNDAIEKDTKSSEDRVDKLLKKREFKNSEEKTRFEEAQKHYLEGFRDYQKGQWIRAMRSFETAYTIDPEHQLAQRYYKYAEKQRDEMVAFQTKEGLSYKDKNMFARCAAAFDKVMDALPNKDDAKYKQAEALRKECDLLEKQKFN